MALESLRSKPSLVGRLRQLRTAALSPSKATFITEKRPSYVPIEPADEQPATYFRDEGPKKPMSNPRSYYYLGPGLDLEELDFRLEQYVKKSLESTTTETDSKTDGLLRRRTSHAQQMKDQVSTVDLSDDEPERDPSSGLEPVASLEPPSQGLGSVESCLHAPQQQEAPDETKPSDYELFMRDAEQAERRRMENKEKPSRPAREPPLNPFYSNQWDHQLQPSPRLGGIQEAADDDAGNDHDGHATTGDEDSDRRALSSEASSERGDVNVAPLKSTISRANTDVTGGRHVTFSNACVPRDRVERRASAPNCATRVKSPSRPVRKQKSIKQLISDYIRPPRG